MVRRELPGLQSALHHETIVSRQNARHAGRERLVDELEQQLPSVEDGWTDDDVGSLAASGSLAAAWASTALALIAASSSDEKLPRTLSTLPGLVDGRVRRTAATEVAFAFNDERDQALTQFVQEYFGNPDEPHKPHRPTPGMFKVWSAVLDGKTCPRCFGADGDTVEMHQSLKAGTPPLHAHCRCIVEHVIIAKTERLEDISIDYDLLKQELRDVIRERREISDRHALGFLSDSLGSKRSPEVLTKRFREERYATPEARAAGGRIVLVTPTGKGKTP